MTVVGLALEQQVLPSHEQLPADDKDWRVDKVITAHEIMDGKPDF